MKRKRPGFTLVELMAVVATIAVLLGLLIPALSMVRRSAKETAQKAQLTTIDLALLAFKNDYGDYPPSEKSNRDADDYYCGAQQLAEALVGWDLLGFHPDSEWYADGKDVSGLNDIYKSADPDNLNERRGPYLDLATANVFKVGDLFDNGKTGAVDPDTYVICDSFRVKRVPVGGRIVKAGTPILYYRADASSKTIEPPASLEERIYNARDNVDFLDLGKMPDDSEPHPLGLYVIASDDCPVFYSVHYDYDGSTGYGIVDPKVEAIPWPYRPDSYILITAGADGLYGTSDDICNFGN